MTDVGVSKPVLSLNQNTFFVMGGLRHVYLILSYIHTEQKSYNDFFV